MVAEERITTKFSGLVGAYGSEEEATFLVDPAGRRGAPHAVLRALSGRGGRRAGRDRRARRAGPARRSHPPSARSSTRRWSQAHERLVAAPGDLAAKVRFVTIYHLILESTLGPDDVPVRDRVPGARGPAARVRRGLLEDPPRRDPSHRLRRLVPARGGPRPSRSRPRPCARRCASCCRRSPRRSAAPATARGPDIERLGVSTDEVRDFALSGLTRRLDIIGVPLSSL